MPDTYLIVEPESADAKLEVYSLAPGCYAVGRAEDKSDIRLNDKAVSRLHCRLFVDPDGKVTVQDENSGSGVKVDDQRISPDYSVRLKPDNNVLVGSYLLYLTESLEKGVAPVPLAPKIHAGADQAALAAFRKPERDPLRDLGMTMNMTIRSGDFRQSLKAAVSKSDRQETKAATAREAAVPAAPPPAAQAAGEIFSTFKNDPDALADGEEKRYTFPAMPAVPAERQKDVDRFIYRRVKPLFEKLVQERSAGRAVRQEETRDMAADILKDLVGQQGSNIPAGIAPDDMVTLCLAAFMDYGPLQTLFGDESVTEVMVNGPNEIYIEKGGRISKSHLRFFNEQELRRVIEKMVAITNRHIDEQQPYQDTRLEDGSRVNVVIRPVALRGDSITIRKFPNKRLFIEDLVRFGAMSEDMAEFLRLIVVHRANTVVSGGTGSGKTTLLNVLSSFIPEHERLVSIEDAAELRLVQPNRVCLESKPKSAEGGRAVTIRDLVINALRMRPDRIVVGECRGGETLDMLQAMNTGHEGSLTTLHANTPRDALNRIETMCLMSGMELPAKAIRNQVVSAVNFIVQQTRLVDGSRKITSVQEIGGMEGEQVVMQEIFKFQRQGINEKGKVMGKYAATGVVPFFVQRLREDRIDFPLDLFEPG